MGMTDIERRALKGAAAVPNISELPVRVPRDAAAELVTQRYFKVSPRTLERWPLTVRRVNGKAHLEVSELFALAESMLAAAQPVMGGHKPAAQRQTR